MKIGQKVMLIGVDNFMPPIGSVGFTLSAVDEDGDIWVDFPGHPCPVSEPEWAIKAVWLMPINEISLPAPAAVTTAD